jgi:hypothetical protein
MVWETHHREGGDGSGNTPRGGRGGFGEHTIVREGMLRGNTP